MRPDPFILLAPHIPKQNQLLAALPAARLEYLLPFWNRFHWNSAGQCTNPAVGGDMHISLVSRLSFLAVRNRELFARKFSFVVQAPQVFCAGNERGESNANGTFKNQGDAL